MKSAIFLTALLASVNAYHDPDLNYHLSQVQNVQGCGDSGYSYPVPAVQLPSKNIQPTTAPLYTKSTYNIASAQSGGYSNNAGYSQSAFYLPPAIQVQPAVGYQAQVSAGAYSAQNEHGYATSSGLSSSSAQRTVTPLATYAQAPIIAKITAAPLQAKFTLSPERTSYATQNLIAQKSSQYSSESFAKASLNSYNVQSSGPIVSQVYAAPSGGYATSPSLRQQSPQVFTSESSGENSGSSQYSASAIAVTAAPVTSSYRAPVVTQYTAPSVSHISAPVIAQYSAPAVTHYSAPAVQYSAPAVTHYSAPTAQYSSSSVAHYSAPVITQHSGPVYTQHSAPIITQHATHVTAPAPVAVAPAVQVAHYGHAKASHAVKNVHTDFLENYDAHPRYAFEYGVNDPHTGDIKQQKEERDGEVVKGQYSLVEPDGSVRTVNYVADWETGFHASVHNSKDSHH